MLSNDNLGRIAKDIGLVDCLNMNPTNRIRIVSDKLAATLIEAICGAVAEDGTLDDVVNVMRALDITLLNVEVTYSPPTQAIVEYHVVRATTPTAWYVIC